MKTCRKALPLLISVGLIIWLACRISLRSVFEGASVLPWQILVPMTLGLMIALYLWDVLCLLTVFADSDKPLTYWQMLRLRGRSYLAGRTKPRLGAGRGRLGNGTNQGNVVHCRPVASVLFGWHEGILLASAALAGSLWVDHPEAAHIRAMCSVLLALLVGLALALFCLPAARAGASNGRDGAPGSARGRGGNRFDCFSCERSILRSWAPMS